MSGSAKGVTASKNRGAVFLRSKGYASRVRTSDQSQVKSIFRMLTRNWKTLTQEQINRWNQTASTQAGRRVLGQTAKISGANLYLRLNFWVVRCGGTPLAEPPALGNIEAPSSATVAISGTSMIFMLDRAPSNTDLRLVVMATAPQSNGVVTGVGRGSALCAPIVLDGSDISLMASYAGKYGAPSAGKPKVFFRYFLVNPSTGEKSLEMLAHGVLGQGPAVQFTLSLSSQDSTKGTVSPAGQNDYNENAVVSIMATPAQNFAFSRWSDGNTTNPRSVTMDRDITLQAEFVRDMHYTVRVLRTPSGGGTVTGGGSYAEGSVATLRAEANDGYHFGGWADDENAPAERQVTVTADADYTAVFIRDRSTYELNTYANDGDFGHVESEQGDGSYDAGVEVVITAVADDDEYHFIRWDDGSVQNPRTVVMDRDRTLTAIFYSEYEVSINPEIVPEGCGHVDGAGWYNIGMPVTLTAVPADGWEFVRWGDDASLPAVRQFVAREDFYVQAVFQSVETFEIRGYSYDPQTGDPIDGCVVTGGGDGYHYGDQVVLTAVAGDGYRFVRWTDTDSTDPQRTVVVEYSENFFAEFEEVGE